MFAMDDMSWGVAAFTIISYLIVAGCVALVLSGVQEGARLSEEENQRIREKWSGRRIIGMSALVAAPSILLLLPLGILIVP